LQTIGIDDKLPTSSFSSASFDDDDDQKFRFATPYDYILLVIGLVTSVISGVSQPVLAIISGRMTNVLLVVDPLSKEFKTEGMKYVYIFLGLGIFVSMNDFCQVIHFCSLNRIKSNHFQYMCFQRVCSRMMTQMRNRYILPSYDRMLDDGVGDKLGVLIRGISMVLTSVIISLVYEWRLALMMIGLIPVSTICMTLLSRVSFLIFRNSHIFLEKSTTEELDKVGVAGAIAEESLMGVKTIQAFNGQEEMVAKYEKHLNAGKRHAIIGGFWGGFFGGLFFFWLMAFMGCGILYGGYLLKIGIIESPGDVFIIVMAMLLGAYFLGLISPHLMVLLNARVAAASIYKTIDRVPRIDPYSTAGKKSDRVVGKVTFRNVHFRYPTRKEAKVLNGLNLTVEPGTSVALVGHSGCGKSTSVGLLTRLYEPEDGSVQIDGIDVRDMNMQWLRNIVGIVQQEPILFNDTIHNNLLIGNPDATREKMIEVCKMANAHDFIKKMPKGYDTVIGDGGVQLSGGQKQRVAIARTLIRDPKVLLLDEATSALDAQSESIVQSALNNAAKGRTTIMIAHRLSTIREADKIVFFEKGVIVESGNHEELVNLGGRYFDLVKAQQFKSDPEDIALEAEQEDQFDEFDKPTIFNRQISTRSSRSSGRSGSEEFKRGTLANHSFDRFRKPSNIPTAEDEAFALRVKETMEKDGEVTAGYLDIFKNAQGNYGYMFIGVVAALIRGLDLPTFALLFSWVFEGFEFVPYGGKMMHRFAMSVIAHCAAGLGIWFFQTLMNRCFQSTMFAIVSENLGVRFRVAAFRNLLYQDAAYFDNPAHAPGSLITRLASDPPMVKAVVDGRMMQVIYAFAAVVACVTIGFITCWQVAILGTSLIAFLGLVMAGLAFKITLLAAEHMENDDAGKVAIEIIENVKTIQLLTRTKRFLNSYENESKKRKRTELRKSVFEAINYSITQNFMYYMSCFCFALAIRIINQGDQPVDKTFRCLMAMMLCCEGIILSAQFFPQFVGAKSAAGQMFNLIYRKPQTGDLNAGTKPEVRGNILFENVKFSYPQRPHQPVMKQLQWTALRGQTVALVGPSGSGKSTCIGMLERFYDVTGGALRIDGQDIKSMSLYHLRTQMALVGQEPRLFVGTIRENICLGLKDVPLEKINKALELANANRFLGNLPAGIDTEVGEKGGQLSGGQKQRIAIARALVRDPKILLLDEATSALDSESERAVQEALDRAREGRTCITIAHRLSSIQNSDLIVYIDDGRVQEAGTHNQLMHMKGKYYELIKKQDLAI
ncbi:CBN-PGP-13 protein, partial [Caenorhabditis brenneri]